MNDKATAVAAATGWRHLPLEERIADKLADLLFASDELLDVIRGGRAERAPDATLFAMEAGVTEIYKRINELMLQVTD